MANKVNEALLPQELPLMVKELGMAVASANAAMAENAGKNGTIYTIPDAEIELKVAVSVSQETTNGVEGGLKINVFNINASYANTYGFSQEASSRITMTLKAVPHSDASQNSADDGAAKGAGAKKA